MHKAVVCLFVSIFIVQGLSLMSKMPSQAKVSTMSLSSSTEDQVVFKSFKWEDLTVDSLYEMLRLRSDVFVVEQDCVFLDLDNEDQAAVHIIGTHRNRIVCCARIFGPDGSSDMTRIGRVVTVSDMRSKGVGRSLMLHAIEECITKWPSAKIKIGAQAHLDSFYGQGTATKPGLGFVRVSEEYLEDGIPHVDMVLDKHMPPR
jgi:ElaA protein